MQRQWLISNACLQLPVVDACAAILIWVTPNQHFKSTLLGRGSQKRVRCENDNNSGRPLRLKKRTSIISIVTAGRLAHFSNVYSLRTIIITGITRLPGHYPASSKSQNTSGSRLTNDGRSRITHKKQALPCSHESAESLSQWVRRPRLSVVFVYYFRNVLFGLFDPHHAHAPTVSGSHVTSTYKILCTVQRVN